MRQNPKKIIASIVSIAFFLPGIIISEPSDNSSQISNTAFNFPFEILPEVTELSPTKGVSLRLEDESKRLSSYCRSKRTIIEKSTDSTLVHWQPLGECQIPIVTYKGKNYVLPITGYFPDISTLSDVSTETLQNTLRASIRMRNNPTSMSFRMRAFYDAIETVIRARDTKLSLPIPHIPLPTKDSHLPNAGRPYRGDSTDGIHHGWDVYTDRGTPVRAVDDGVIFHIYRDFTWDDMKKLHPANSHLEEQENLDIYRGNTVYLKTNSGNVAIYAHLDDIPKDLAVGQRVTRGAIVGHVGDSAVPDKKYLYHLHFEIAMNPYVDRRAGEYGFTDVLLWPYFGQDQKTTAWVRENQDELFDNESLLHSIRP